MRFGVRSSAVVLLLGAGLASAPVFATNGFIPHGFSAKEKGRAGTGSAMSVDTLAAGNNPAGMVFVGNRWDVGGDIFSPRRSYSTTASPGDGCSAQGCTFTIGPNDIDSENEAFLVPHFGYNKMLDSQSSIGISVYGAGGMNTEYKGGTANVPTNPAAAPGSTHTPLPGTFGNGTAGVDLSVLFAGLTYARKINEDSAWGVTGVFAYSMFSADGLDNFAGFSADPANIQKNSTDSATGFGLKAGWQGAINSAVSLGVSYQTKIDMSEFDDYAGLFAEQGNFDIPAIFNAGLLWNIGESRRFLVDVQQIYYSDVPAVGNSINNLLVDGQPFGADDGAGFGWDDMTILKFGYEWDADSEWTWRLGFSHGEQPISSEEVTLNILAPAVIEDHLTFGFTKAIDADSELTFHAMHALSNDVTGPNALNPQQNVTIEMDQFEVGLSYGRRF